MKHITCVKLGGSVITDKDTPYKANLELLTSLAILLKDIKTPLIISHGSGSFGHTSAKIYGGKKGYTSTLGIATVSKDARAINSIVSTVLLEQKLPVIALSPMSMIQTEKGEIKKEFFCVVKEVLDQGLIPVLYGDVIWDTKWKSTILSGERILQQLISYLLHEGYTFDKIFQLTNTDGVYDDNKQTIPVISHATYPSLEKYIFSSNHVDVTGGMKHKVEESLSLTKRGIPTWIINGYNLESVKSAFSNKLTQGTQII